MQRVYMNKCNLFHTRVGYYLVFDVIMSHLTDEFINYSKVINNLQLHYWEVNNLQ